MLKLKGLVTASFGLKTLSGNPYSSVLRTVKLARLVSRTFHCRLLLGCDDGKKVASFASWPVYDMNNGCLNTKMVDEWSCVRYLLDL